METEQEKLKEFTQRFLEKWFIPTVQDVIAMKQCIKAGVEWQKEQMYSEEEIKRILFKFTSDFGVKKNIEITQEEQNKWFKNYKNK